MDTNTWRFSTHTNGEYMGSPVTVIQRGRMYRLPADWRTDSWRDYWDGDQMVAVYDDLDYTAPTEGEDTQRVEFALSKAREYDQDIDDMLDRLAKRIFRDWGYGYVRGAGFVAVGLDRGVTLYALSWDVEDVDAWRDEIKAVCHGDIYRCEVAEYDPATGEWAQVDEVCDEWYGEAAAEAGFAEEFPLAEFPAELLVSSDG